MENCGKLKQRFIVSISRVPEREENQSFIHLKRNFPMKSGDHNLIKLAHRTSHSAQGTTEMRGRGSRRPRIIIIIIEYEILFLGPMLG